VSLHPQAQLLLDDLASPGSGDVRCDVVGHRAAARAAALAATDRIGLDLVDDLDAGGVPTRLYRSRLGAPVALYVHGGGWVMHDLETHDAFCRYLVHTTGWALLSVDYRRAPEHPFPAPLDDVETAARWLREYGRDHRVDIDFVPGIGDSSGANLVAALSVRAPGLLDAQMLMYPATDRTAPLSRELSTAALDVDVMPWFWAAYAPDIDVAHPEVSPGLAPDLSGQPPTLLVTCEHDVLAAQGRAFAARLAEAGVPVTSWEAAGMVHSFWRQPQRFDASGVAVNLVGATLDSLRHRARSLS
jgi:acetyl esterase